ncbi:helix-turn-helix transcriptional regulator [Nitrobacter hamburgensis]|jgi:prophage regulatory protein|uniref:helix-turn-helix transcriptional regulator n=1 Tax=Nitrobacter hamburgensis TaxID=912 RepID=UPI00031536FE|nr:AlpA family phage regulatory protein [Nitrobacter hamburgensis]
MRFLSKKAVRDLISLSYATIDREEQAGTFPKRLRRGSRVMWLQSEVEEWMRARVAERDAKSEKRPQPKGASHLRVVE